jgi:hypothetical protein
MNPNSKQVQRRLMILKYVISYAYRNPPLEIMNELSQNWTTTEREDFEKELEMNNSELINSLKSYGLWEYVCKTERVFLSMFGSQMDMESRMEACWKMESAIVLMWALKLIDQFPSLNEQTNTELLQLVEIKKLGLFSSDLTLRPHAEISKMRAIIELWHWRVRTRRLIEDNYEFEPDENMINKGYKSLDDIVKKAAAFAYEKGDIREIINEDFVVKGNAFRDLNTDDFNEATSIIIERHRALNWLCGYAPGNAWDQTPTDT